MDKQVLHRFFEGTSSYAEEAAVKRWMEEDPANRRTLLKERKLFDAMLLLEKEAATAPEKEVAPRRRHAWLVTVLKVAAIVLLTLGLDYFGRLYLLPEEPVAMQAIHVPAGQRVNLRLPDGSDVWLNARTTLRYPFQFAKGVRQVELDGEAFFDVAKEQERPFIVNTSKGTVEVHGTQFDVEAYSDRPEFETTLMAGSVTVTSGLNPSDRLTLRPDEKAYLCQGKLGVAKVDDYNPYRWKEGLICFRNESFDNIMKDFEQYYGIEIHVDNRRVQAHSYTGKFRQADGIDYALRVLQKDIRFAYHRDDEHQVIYIK